MKKIFLIISLILGALSISSCKGDNENLNLKTVTVACTPVPHAEIMNEIKDMMKEKGYNLIVKEFSDYVTPNLAVDEGEVDANFFQHMPYLMEFNAEKGTNVVSVVPVHYEPFGIYAGKSKSLKLNDGDKIAVPNDVTNEARALNLLQDAGFISLKEGVGLTATINDIMDNPYNLDIVEIESAQIPRTLDSVAVACMNGNYAIQAGYKVSDALYVENKDSEAAKTYANIICVKSGNENADYVLALVECVKSDRVRDFIDKTYDKSVIYID